MGVGPLSAVLRRGALFSAVALGGTQVVALLQTLVLARLLEPAEIGGFAAGTVLTGFLSLIAEGGLRQALVQRPGDDVAVEAAANTVFWAALGAGLLGGGLALAVSPAIGWFFGSPQAAAVAAATSGLLVVRALTHVPDALMQRRFQFRRRLVIDPAVALAFPAVAVPLCLAGAGVRGLVAGAYASEAAWVVSALWLSRWRPGGTRPSIALWREMARFSFPLLVAVVADRVRQLLEIAIVGRLLGTAGLGLYRYGRRVGDLPGRAVVEIGAFVLLPAFARIADDRDRFRAAFRRSLHLLWTAAVPVAGLLVAAGGAGVTVLLGPSWRGAGPLVEAMAGWGPGMALLAVAGEALKGAGRSRRLHGVTAVALVCGIGLLPVLAPAAGLTGVGLALSVSQLAAGGLAVLLVRPVVGLARRDLWSVLWPAALAGAVATVAVAVLERMVLRSADHPFPTGAGMLLADVAAFGLVYLLALRVVDRRAVDALVAAARRRARPGRPVTTKGPQGGGGAE